MAQVPYEQGIPEVAPEVRTPDDLSHVQVNPEQFGAAVGHATSQAGQSLEGAGTALKQTAENLFNIADFQGKVNTDDQVNKTNAAWGKILNGDPTKAIGTDPDGKPIYDMGFLGLSSREAADQRQSTLEKLEEIRKAGRENLQSPKDQLLYDEQTRRMYSMEEAKIGAHTEQQWKIWAIGVNGAGAQQSLTAIANNAYNPVEVAHHTSDLINFRVQQAQVRFGNDPTIKKQAYDEARQESLSTQLESIAVKDPAMAIRMLDKNKDIAGTKYDELSNKFRVQALQDDGRTIGGSKIAEASTGATPFFAGANGAVTGAQTMLRNFEGLKTDAYWDVNHWRVGYGSDTVTKADGTVVPVTQGMKVTQEDAERDLQRRTTLSQTTAKGQIGDATWQSLTPQAQAAITSVAYNYGSVPNSVVTAAQNGNSEAISNAILSLSQDNNGVNANRRAAEAGIVAGRSIPLLKANAFQLALSDPKITPEQLPHVLQFITQYMNANEIAENQGIRVQKQKSEAAGLKYVTEFYDGLHNPKGIDLVELSGRVNHDPDLDVHMKTALMDRFKKVSGEEEALSFGPGYTDVLNRMLSPSDAKDHISTFGEVVGRTDITNAGLKALNERVSLARKSPDNASIAKRSASYLAGIKNYMAIDEDNGMGFKIRNPEGEKIFNWQVQPEFEKRVAALQADAAKSGDYKPLDDFLSEKGVRQFVDGFYNKQQIAMAKMTAEYEATGKEPANMPAPPAPTGADAKGWDTLMKRRPLTADKTPLPYAIWSAKIGLLAKEPTPEMAKLWDQSTFARSGVTGAEIIKQLTGKDINQATPATGPTSPNLAAADKALNLTPQEKALYERHLTNLSSAGGVDNPDGSRSTLYQSVQEHNGKFYNVPTVWDGKRETKKYTRPSDGEVFDVPNAKAMENINKVGWDKFPSYSTAAEADERYEQMHKFMKLDTAEHLAKPAEAAPSPQPKPNSGAYYGGPRKPPSKEEIAAADAEIATRDKARRGQIQADADALRKSSEGLGRLAEPAAREKIAATSDKNARDRKIAALDTEEQNVQGHLARLAREAQSGGRVEGRKAAFEGRLKEIRKERTSVLGN